MEGLIAADGGRVLRSNVLAFGAFIWAAPLFAQAAPDPLAPLPTPTPSQQQAVRAAGPIPTSTVQAPAPSVVSAAQVETTEQPLQVPLLSPPERPVRPVYVPKDWRGVFDAIDTGQWSSAKAGIAALPRSVLTPVAKAE